MNAVDYLDKFVNICIDRPVGSMHPDHGFEYLVNYGFVPGTLSPDGEELDSYILGISEPIEHFYGRCIAIIHRLDDADDKLVVVPDGLQISDSEICRLTYFQEQYFISEILRS